MTANKWLNNHLEVQTFLGFCNDYRRFTAKYSEKPEPLTRLTKKDELFIWGSEQQLAFQIIFSACTTAQTLQHFNHEREVRIETHGSV